MVPFAEGQANGKTGIDPNGATVADVKVTTLEVAGDGSGLLFSKRAWPLGRPERRSAGVIVIVILRRHSRHLRKSSRSCERRLCGGRRCLSTVLIALVRVRIRACCPEAAL